MFTCRIDERIRLLVMGVLMPIDDRGKIQIGEVEGRDGDGGLEV